MADKPRPGLSRAREEIAAARVLLEREFPLQAVSRAYYAAFYAAEEALLELGETRSSHAGVISEFGKRVVRKSDFDDTIAPLLSSLFDARNRADYGPGRLPQEDAEEAVRDAERFVGEVEAWLRRDPGG